MPGRRQLIFYIYFLTLLFPRFRTPSRDFYLCTIFGSQVCNQWATHTFFKDWLQVLLKPEVFWEVCGYDLWVQRIFLVSSLQKPFPPACPNNGRLLFNYKFDNPTDGREREWVSPAFCPCEFSILSALGNTSILKVSIMVSILAELDWGEGLVFTKLGQG